MIKLDEENTSEEKLQEYDFDTVAITKQVNTRIK